MQLDAKPKNNSRKRSEVQMLAWNYFGIKFTVIPRETYKRLYSQYLNIYPDGAIRVSEVRPNSPMAVGDIEPGDIIFTIDDCVTSNEDDIYKIVPFLQESKPQASDVKVRLHRPHPYDSESANGHFIADVKLPPRKDSANAPLNLRQTLELEQKQQIIKVFSLANTSAVTLRETVQTAIDEKGFAEKCRVTVDSRTNSLILVGTQEAVDAVGEIVRQHDVAP